uniref:hypothetical protein n=1 Tax=Planococcus sp. ZOYM TaxID=378212 RepID=UPI0018686B7A|nr:hypothetical protein [Planococcus sp. ZOYM]
MISGKPQAPPGLAPKVIAVFPYALSLFLTCCRLKGKGLVLFVISKEEEKFYGVFSGDGTFFKSNSRYCFLFEFDFNY